MAGGVIVMYDYYLRLFKIDRSIMQTSRHRAVCTYMSGTLL